MKRWCPVTAFIFLSESVGINTTPLIYTRSHWCLAVIWYLHCSAESIKTLHMYLSTSGPQRTELGGFNDVSLTSDVRERQIEEGSSGGFPRGMFFLVWFVFQAQQKNSPDLDHRRGRRWEHITPAGPKAKSSITSAITSQLRRLVEFRKMTANIQKLLILRYHLTLLCFYSSKTI